MVRRIVFAHDDCPVRCPAFRAVHREPTIFLFSKPLQKFNIPQRCHYFGYRGRMRRRSSPPVGRQSPSNNAATGLPVEARY